MNGALDSGVIRDLSTQVCQYFLDFLESDFKKQQAPRRRVVLQTESGFKAGMRVSPYPLLQTAIWSLLERRIEEECILEFPPRRYLKSLSQALSQVIKEHVKAVKQDQIDTVVNELARKTESNSKKRIEAPEQWMEDLQLVLHMEISAQIVRPLLSLIDEALSRQAYSQEDSIFNAESDLVQRIAAPLNEVLTDLLAKYSVSTDTGELITVAKERLSLDAVKQSLGEYFESFASSDSFLEFRDIDTYANTVEGIQLYLYIGTLKFSSAIYPLFYIPIDTERVQDRGGYQLRLSNHIYTNRKAIDFALQEVGTRQSRQIVSPLKDRITYVPPNSNILQMLDGNLVKLKEAFGLFGNLVFADGPVAQLSDTHLSLSNALHICAFERSDEALLNDYEEMITVAKTNGEGVLKLFEDIVAGVITSNPVSIESQIQSAWESTPIEERVVPDTPIPLNEEQIKVLAAISNPTGKFVVVEGPPGTGKSHTIVAIAADCAFNRKSCLILSDKPEALEVVHSKLSNAMNEARGSEDFPNPLLKLGTDQPNFKKLTSQQTLTQVQAHVVAAKTHRKSLEESRNSKRDSLKRSITGLRETLGNLSTQHLASSQHLANTLDDLSGVELSSAIDALPHNFDSQRILEELDLDKTFAAELEKFLSIVSGDTIDTVSKKLTNLCYARNITAPGIASATKLAPRISGSKVDRLSALLSEYRQLRRPIIGYLFRGSAIESLNQKIQELERFSKQIDLKKDENSFRELLDLCRLLRADVEKESGGDLEFDFLYSYLADRDFTSPSFQHLLGFIRTIKANYCDRLNTSLFLAKYPNENHRTKIWLASLRYFHSVSQVKSVFDKAPEFDFVGRKTEVEHLNTSLMNSEVDSRLVSFMQNSKTDAKILANLIKDRQKFPEQMFGSVKEAFPVIVASIREYGEYMPLDKDIFDVLVIDEASQVSVAQAFPALLRAKKVVVMGDSKQFSNTKSSNASISLNEKYRADLVSYFRSSVSSEAAMLQRLSYFDVKKSVLEFSQLCANYSIMLRKHFRSYQELIGYSSKNFYGGQLQAIKIRGVPLEDVIKFHFIDPTDVRASRNTNSSEADFILSQLDELINEDSAPTVGIITPFREQQTLLSKRVSVSPNYDEYKRKLRLKIMTFDSCQGEERNLIFYSMVATTESDNLNYIFPVSLEDPQESVESKLKVQRLNVGFSRAQEAIWFVLSKPISDFKGSIGQALRHYDLESKTTRSSREQTDPLSPMEQKVHDWIYSTSFFQNNSEKIEVIPQFPLGDYLRQLDPTYRHPAWKVDFLVTFYGDKGLLHIVIEYDGFEFHFKKGQEIDIGNHERFLNDSDIERQLTLESYGYRFIRLNRFNIGKDPVQSLSDRLNKLVESHTKEVRNDVIERAQSDASAIIDKSAKECPKCLVIKPIGDFFDSSLRNGAGANGRVCLACKSTKTSEKITSKRPFRRRWR